MADHYDTIIIGGGPGGLATAYALNATQRVLVVENNLWGGTCPNFGCDPKKMLYGVVEAKRQTQRYQASGVSGQVSVDWPAMMSFKHSYTDGVPGGTAAGLKQSGIDHLDGTASFVDAHTLDIAGQQVSADHIVIATGATPTIPDIEGREHFKTSTDFLDLPTLPHKIGFVGAGYVAIELANIAAEAGAEVHVFQHNQRILRGFPEAYTKQVQQQLTNKGVQFHMDTNVTALTASAAGVTVATDTAEPQQLDIIIAAAGRRPNVDHLALENAGIRTTAKGIVVDDHLQTTATDVYAIGDVIAKTTPKLTPVSGLEGRYVASVIDQQSTTPIAYPAIPHTVFAGPELAEVGVTLEQAEADEAHYVVRDQLVGNWYTYHRIKDDTARVTTIQDKTSGQLVGAVVLAVNAEELINHFTEMITKHQSADDASDWVPVYPSVASDLNYFYN